MTGKQNLQDDNSSSSQWASLDSVSAELNFPGKQTERHARLQPDGTLPDRDTVPVSIYNGRPRQNELSLDREGFVVLPFDSGVTDYDDLEQIETVWKPQVEKLVQEFTGASKVITWANLTRFSPRSPESKRTPMSAPASDVHGDFGPGKFGEEIDHPDISGLVKDAIGTTKPKKYRCFNIWQPISKAPFDVPLALCDASTVEDEDICFLSAEFNFGPGPAFEIELTSFKHNPNQRWAYFPDLNNEILIFSGLDPAAGPTYNMVPHCAFTDPSCPPDTVPRNSIEMRAIAIFE